LPGWKQTCASRSGFCYASSVLSRSSPYAAFVPGFRNQFLRITVGGFFGRPAHSAAWRAGRRWCGRFD
jgi:hypothetical protein